MGDEISNRVELASLTAKQREVLDLLIQHKTSKQIARALIISPFTVDQRLAHARRKLAVSSRNELAVTYRRMLEICESPAYQFPHVDFPLVGTEESGGADEDGPDTVIAPSWSETTVQQGTGQDIRIVPAIFEGRNAILFRLAAIGTITVLLLVVMLATLAIYSQLSDLFG